MSRPCLAFTAIFLTSLASTPLAWAQEKLKPVGALHCEADIADHSRMETSVSCEVRLTRGDIDLETMLGRIDGNGLWLVRPGRVRLLFHILAANDDIEPKSVAGEYKQSLPDDFDVEIKREDVLFKAEPTPVALRLIVPAVDGTDKNTVMKLKLR